jgi:cystathionine gamma-synthase
MHDRNRATWVVAAGRTRTPGTPLNVAPEFASNYYLPAERVYSRSDGTTTSLALEEVLGGLEGGQALVFSSGMAAAAAVLHRLPVGAHVVVSSDPYHGVEGLLEEGVGQGRWRVTHLDPADTGAWLAAAREADLLWIESPSNPLLVVADLPAICSAPRKPGAIVAVDSTFGTPLNQQPLDYGADVVMHSATKFLGGHSDLVAGVLVTRNQDLQEELHRRRLLYGGTIGAMESFLTLRGLRTLSLRMERSQANAMELARRLEAHPQVARVRYPGLPSHPTHRVAASFMKAFGALISFDPTGPGERASDLCARLQLIHHATSLGGVESTMERRSVIPGQERIPPSLIRFSVGCEDVDDIWADLDAALEGSRRGPAPC